MGRSSKIILFFGTEKEFKKFNYDFLYTENIEFKLCTSFNDVRGINFNSYIIHYSAPNELQIELSQNKELLKHLIQRKVYLYE
jgi:hypothetical protein